MSIQTMLPSVIVSQTAQLDATRPPGFDPEKKAAIKSWLVERIETAMKKELEAPSSLPNTQG